MIYYLMKLRKKKELMKLQIIEHVKKAIYATRLCINTVKDST